MQLSIAVPEPMTLVGDIVLQVSPDGTAAENVTVPANPLTALTLMLEVANEPTLTVGGAEATTVKSTKLNFAVVLFTMVPLVPVIVSV